jgi:hypothetical protein
MYTYHYPGKTQKFLTKEAQTSKQMCIDKKVLNYLVLTTHVFDHDVVLHDELYNNAFRIQIYFLTNMYHIFFISLDGYSYFAIESSTGVLSLANLLDVEYGPVTWTVNIIATDGAGSSKYLEGDIDLYTIVSNCICPSNYNVLAYAPKFSSALFQYIR